MENCFHFDAKEACFWWDGLGTFQVRDGKDITIETLPGVEEERVRIPLLGIVMAVLFHQRGLLVLHGSAVALAGGAVVFLGGKGYGKSTMAAALHARGHPIVADDMVVVEVGRAGECMVLPGFPRLSLWPDSASAVGEDPDSLHRLAPDYDKRAHPAWAGFSQRPRPLKRVYALAEGQAPALTPLRPRDAFPPLIANSSVSRFGSRLLVGEQASLHFRQATDLVSKVPVYRLERPRALRKLAAVARLVEEGSTRDGAPAASSLA